MNAKIEDKLTGVCLQLEQSGSLDFYKLAREAIHELKQLRADLAWERGDNERRRLEARAEALEEYREQAYEALQRFLERS